MLSQLITPVTGLLDKFITDKDQAAKLAHEIATMADNHAQELAKGQLAVNKAEAESGSLFIGGWRPFVGWVCGIGLMYNVILSQFLAIWFKVPTVDPISVNSCTYGHVRYGCHEKLRKKIWSR